MEKDLTGGSIWKQLVSFTIPLILGNLFQLTYNAVDSIVVGQFAGDRALAAVGTADPLMNLLILGITGLCIGGSVLMSHFFGAGDREKLKCQMGAMILLGMGLSVLVFVLGLSLAEPFLKLMRAPREILGMSASYLRIIFVGMPFTCLYNIYSAALRSVGDAKTPLRFLMLAAVLNVCLDLVFVALLRLGVEGAGLATDIAEAVSALLCMVYVRRKVPLLHLKKNHFVPEKQMLIRTVQCGGITALQQCSQPFGKLLIQGAINPLGVSTIAAFNAVGKIEDFALVPGRSISNAIMTFTAQNEGAGKKKRIREGFQKGMILEAGYWILICGVLLVFGEEFLSLFSSDSLTRMEGLRYFSVMAFCYWLPGFNNGLQGFFRGVGKMQITLWGTLTQISFRVLFTFLLVPKLGITGVAFACVIGWSVMLLWEAVYYVTYAAKHLRE